MKVLAINSSPNKDKGNTALILDPFLEGMKEEGAEVDVYYTEDLKINPCQGELSCHMNPGKCFQDDDMNQLLLKVSQADILVLASPLYCDGVTGPMKIFIDRLVPLLQATFDIHNDHIRHPPIDEMNLEKVVLVSNCGLWEMDNFDPMMAHIEAICKNIRVEFAGGVLRPHGTVLKIMLEMGMPVNDIFESAKEAGRQLVQDGKIHVDILENVSRPLLPRDMYMQSTNQRMQEMMQNNK